MRRRPAPRWGLRAALALVAALGAGGIAGGCRLLLGELSSIRQVEAVAVAARQEAGPPSLARARQEAPCCQAWLEVPGAQIDLPLAQADASDPDFFLGHALDGRPSSAGTPYVDARSPLGSRHVIVYGHHLTSVGGMFSALFCCHQQREFDERCRPGAILTTPAQGRVRLSALCALSVDKSNQDVQRFAWRDAASFRTWLEGLCHDATARAPDAEALVARATGAVSLVTCSSIWSGRRGRTVVVFVRTQGSKARLPPR
ncbi:class B sortase [Olsenella sp. HMSC062G07]|uniref:class B sortase n=1 Tax=Olsenella sp. HMSC062G07 TaxID=1739330 RepID=UPI0008A4AFD4|nr:class B sortase [Olsenella sp. HMSC062G07]OFK24824.1 hypothetical protein HMPREF2826_06275 [Olsenella sp. HMSC062G07]